MMRQNMCSVTYIAFKAFGNIRIKSRDKVNLSAPICIRRENASAIKARH
jgi:hypothetical protein